MIKPIKVLPFGSFAKPANRQPTPTEIKVRQCLAQSKQLGHTRKVCEALGIYPT